MNKVLIAPVKFKGSLSAHEVCNAVEQGILNISPNTEVIKHKEKCAPCHLSSHQNSCLGNHSCMVSITQGEVLAKTKSLLDRITK